MNSFIVANWLNGISEFEHHLRTILKQFLVYWYHFLQIQIRILGKWKHIGTWNVHNDGLECKSLLFGLVIISLNIIL